QHRHRRNTERRQRERQQPLLEDVAVEDAEWLHGCRRSLRQMLANHSPIPALRAVPISRFAAATAASPPSVNTATGRYIASSGLTTPLSARLSPPISST